MAAAIIGFIGVTFGAVAALVGTSLSDRRRARDEDRRWRRDRTAAAYEETLHYLSRAASRRSSLVTGEAGIFALLSGDHVREWFDDLTEARHWMRVLTTRCGEDQALPIARAAEALEDACALMDTSTGREARESETEWSRHVCRQVLATNPIGIEPTMRAIQYALRVVTDCARIELGSLPVSTEPFALSPGKSIARR